MRLKHDIVRAALALYFIVLFVCVHLLNPKLIRTSDRFDVVTFCVGTLTALYFALRPRSVIAPVTLYIWLFVFSLANPMVKEVHFDYIGWMLLYFAIYALRERNAASQRLFFLAALLTFGASYTTSGIIKWLSPTWMSGDIFMALVDKRFFFDWFKNLTSGMGAAEWMWISKLGAVLEIAALPMILYPRTRFAIWCGLTLMQVFLLVATRINHISAAMLIFHALCFDPAWWPRKERRE